MLDSYIMKNQQLFVFIKMVCHLYNYEKNCYNNSSTGALGIELAKFYKEGFS